MRTPIRLGDVDPRLLAGVVEAFGIRMAAQLGAQFAEHAGAASWASCVLSA